MLERAARSARQMHPGADGVLAYAEDDATVTVVVRVNWVLTTVQYTDLDRVSGPPVTLSPNR